MFRVDFKRYDDLMFRVDLNDMMILCFNMSGWITDMMILCLEWI